MRLPWLATLRRVVLSGSAFVVLGCFANHVRAWEGDFYGYMPVHVGLTIAARVGCVVVLLVGLWLLLRWGVGQWLSRRKKAEPEPEPTETVEDGEAVQAELEKQIPLLERSEIARVSIDTNGKIIVADTLSAAIEIANEIAPEHLELCVDNPFDYLDSIRHAGSVFMGKYCPEALGDYFAGPNHTLPTSGTAKFSSPLSVDDFVKKTQFIYYSEEALAEVAEDVAYFARQEGLTAHAKSAVIRLEMKK